MIINSKKQPQHIQSTLSPEVALMFAEKLDELFKKALEKQDRQNLGYIRDGEFAVVITVTPATVKDVKRAKNLNGIFMEKRV